MPACRTVVSPGRRLAGGPRLSNGKRRVDGFDNYCEEFCVAGYQSLVTINGLYSPARGTRLPARLKALQIKALSGLIS